MDLSVVTPSFRDSRWLKLCISSVADQAGISCEHIVQDAVSDDGTLVWLLQDKRVKAFIEKDQGMYDAVNRGFRRAKGEVLSYINCDEQYLPGALKKVSDFFKKHAEVDVLFADCIVTDGRGQYLCERRALTPQLFHTWTCPSLSFLTAATFIRRRVIDEHHLFFSPKLRVLGDVEWTLRLVKSGLKMAVLREFIAVFTDTGNNMSLCENAAREREELRARAPLLARLLRHPILAHFRWRRWRAGHYSCKIHDYAIYTLDNSGQRKRFHVAKPTFRWTRSPQNLQAQTE